MHHDQLTDAEHELMHESADGLVDFIKLIFHTDMGEGHLENFETGHALDFELTTIASTNPCVGVISDVIYLMADEQEFIADEYYLRDKPLPRPVFHSSFSLRGPPSIS